MGPICVLESRIEALQRVGGMRNQGIYKIVKHIGNRVVDEMRSPFQVGVRHLGSWQRIHGIPITPKPASPSSKEPVACSDRSDPTQSSQKFAQVSARLAFGVASEPNLSLHLDVPQAALNPDAWPHQSYGSDDRSLSVHGDTARFQSPGFQFSEPTEHLVGAFLGRVNAGDDSGIGGVHEADETSILMEIGSVVDQVAVCTVIGCLGRRLIQPVTANTFEFEGAVPRKLAQLPDRVAFVHPKFEPMPFAKPFDESEFPYE